MPFLFNYKTVLSKESVPQRHIPWHCRECNAWPVRPGCASRIYLKRQSALSVSFSITQLTQSAIQEGKVSHEWQKVWGIILHNKHTKQRLNQHVFKADRFLFLFQLVFLFLPLKVAQYGHSPPQQICCSGISLGGWRTQGHWFPPREELKVRKLKVATSPSLWCAQTELMSV